MTCLIKCVSMLKNDAECLIFDVIFVHSHYVLHWSIFLLFLSIVNRSDRLFGIDLNLWHALNGTNYDTRFYFDSKISFLSVGTNSVSRSSDYHLACDKKIETEYVRIGLNTRRNRILKLECKWFVWWGLLHWRIGPKYDAQKFFFSLSFLSFYIIFRNWLSVNLNELTISSSP